jgi:hypothetical protein
MVSSQAKQASCLIRVTGPYRCAVFESIKRTLDAALSIIGPRRTVRRDALVGAGEHCRVDGPRIMLV